MAAPTSPASRHNNPALPGFYGPEPQLGLERPKHSKRPSSYKETRVRTLSSSKDHAIQLDQLRGRNQWLQYAVAGFAAWSVATTYMVVSYQGEEREDLQGKIAMLKAGLFDYQSTAENVLEVAYRNVEGPRSFAEISASLALNDVAPIDSFGKPYGAEGANDGSTSALSSEALLAHPHPEALVDEALAAAQSASGSDTSAQGKAKAKTKAAKALKSAKQQPAQALLPTHNLASTGDAVSSPATKLKLSPYQPIFGLAAQYSLLGEPREASKASFGQVEDLADQLSLSSRLPMASLKDSLTKKLMPVSVAKLSLNGKKPGSLRLKSYRRAPKRAVQAKRSMVASSTVRARKAQVGDVQINAYPGRSATGRSAGVTPFSRGSQAPSGDVAKLVLP